MPLSMPRMCWIKRFSLGIAALDDEPSALRASLATGQLLHLAIVIATEQSDVIQHVKFTRIGHVRPCLDVIDDATGRSAAPNLTASMSARTTRGLERTPVCSPVIRIPRHVSAAKENASDKGVSKAFRGSSSRARNRLARSADEVVLARDPATKFRWLSTFRLRRRDLRDIRCEPLATLSSREVWGGTLTRGFKVIHEARVDDALGGLHPR